MVKKVNKRTMADRGKFDTQNTDYDEPYDFRVSAAVNPYSAKSAASIAVWGDTLVESVPPAYALRYSQLQADLDVAMRGGDYQLCASLAASLIKAIDVMDEKARADGFKPPVIDGYIVAYGDKVYCFLASGSAQVVRRARPNWIVYHMTDVCAVMSVRTDEMMKAVVNEFPAAKIKSVKMIDDEFSFGE